MLATFTAWIASYRDLGHVPVPHPLRSRGHLVFTPEELHCHSSSYTSQLGFCPAFTELPCCSDGLGSPVKRQTAFEMTLSDTAN